MGILKLVGKTLGTATLVTTGAASSILKGMSDAVGFELGSEILGAAKDASFNGVRSIWSDKELKSIDKMENLDSAARRKMAETARQAAKIAKEHGDMEKYEYYMNMYESNKD